MTKDSFIQRVQRFFYRHRAIIFILGLAAVSILGIVHIFNVSSRHNVELLTQSSVDEARKAFHSEEVGTKNMLSATLNTLSRDTGILEDFIAGDRDKLFRRVQPLFQHLRSQNSITHWYFIDPEPAKTCFLRVHAPHLYNDVITRSTLEESIKTRRIAFGKELGKTALALRAVHPYFHNGRIIGYMELAIEMQDFFNMLKDHTASDYGLLVAKKYLDRSKWESVVNEAGISDNWNEMAHLVLVSSTCECVREGQYQRPLEAIESIPDSGMVLEMVQRDGNYFVRGIFPFYDASGRKAGGIFVLKNITPLYTAYQNQKREILLIILAFMGIVTFFMIFFHTRAGRELRKYRSRLEEMVEEKTMELVKANIRLELEIEDHKEVQAALEEECRARSVAEKKQVEAVKHAERASRLASIGVMAASITHEINQPLNAIKVTADSIQYWHRRNPGQLPEPFTDQLGIISKSVKRIVEIIQHMRTFWVIPNTPKISAVDINKAVKNALSLTRQQLHTHGIREQIDLTAQPLNVKGNLVHFEQIIVNLVVNAVHALDEHKNNRNKQIAIRTFSQNGNVVLTVADNGPGLPDVEPEKLFDPFFSTHNSGEGMGLGLAIVKRHIDRYNGIIDVGNKEDGGAVFTIKFPSTAGEPA